ncbi:BREX-2 system adenine-specific DNA-methyltransferase PglX [Pseudarthrobacter sp. NIBRBAC000502771]|uniref:BREX-2 system adenine-specific DNA-methyltransferase PglX n=1 Tax=Pseudarthrobacter sp. NIBRBAC000502771 TaxID=2590774 RepID=UPI0011315504|nr:BREX-2 system adenine-specific DNA-methyltransferase PglX [Pseudarthrobacter sp. NIBRBAC000502771]QDG64424.1 BREX-2 system adenine-specific DNA-methyltransferase PglX [Pseudarthrobacter sp. NIBRBAC000502771]
MTIGKDLTPKLQKLVLRVEDDLRARLEEGRELKAKWQSEHADALHAGRASSAWVSWRDDRITQAAVGWVLTTVFLRFCEDNALLSKVWISGPGARSQEAFDAENAYFRAHPENTWREWILEGITHLQSFPATAALVDGHSALWQVSPSGTMAKEILDFWRATDEAGVPVYNFQDSELSTRFLGDLYQDLSEYAKKTFALLQTPEFVEEFILDQTLTPALAERPLEGFKLIDPTCGSGHFLLGGFQRLLDAWSAKAPNLDTRERVQMALDAIHGVDLNPFAVAIARFRLTIAALQATGELDLECAPDFSIHLAAGDSLLYGRADRTFEQEGFDLDAQMSGFAYSVEDRELLETILTENQYDVVVGNPPYIAVKDKTLNERYRKLYKTCKGKYALSVPFMERFFRLAKFGSDKQTAGWTGQITSNSFMKREFGSKVIEDYLTRQDLRLVVDTSGAYIPGHGTPTVILVGKHQHPVSQTVRAVLGVQGEPGRPEDHANGLVWRAITDNIDRPGHDGQWISVADLPRRRLSTHPWSLSGGGASELQQRIENSSKSTLGNVAKEIGIVAVIGEEEAFEVPARIKWPTIPVVLGEGVRDFSMVTTPRFWPYDGQLRPLSSVGASQWLWPRRRVISGYLMFGKTRVERGMQWFEYGMLAKSKLETDLSIAFAEVATHNHFVLDRGGKVFNRTAPVIKLPADASEDEHVALLGLLNSSTVCFWLKQNCYPKGGDPVGTDGARVSQQPWSDRYQFNGANVSDIPLPNRLPTESGRQLDSLAGSLSSTSPFSLVNGSVPSAAALSAAERKSQVLRRQMVAIQEELDWEAYSLYGLIGEDLTYKGDSLPEVQLGQRAFEITLARGIADGTCDSTWFTRHRSTPVTEIPAEWSEDYRTLVRRRIDAIKSNPSIRLLEKPEFKRRWAIEPWEKVQEQALRGWLLDKLEDRSYWFDAHDRPVARSISQVADIVSRDPDTVSVLALWDRTLDVDVTKALTKLLTDEAVPYLAAQRLKDSGLRKREVWEETWELQRREDNGEDVGKIPVPPKYAPADFRKASYWQARGRLDVLKERFILYQDAGRSTDPTLLLGWAGWDHVQQFLVLATIMDERIAEGTDDSQLIPLVAGMAEVLPWIKQWHADLDPTFGMSMADFCSAQLEERMTQLNVSTTDLKAWRPATATRGRRAVKENA